MDGFVDHAPTRLPGSPSSLSIVLPCFQEEATVDEVVLTARAAGRHVADRVEVVAVDDGSTDRTGPRLQALSLRVPELRLVRHRRNHGYGTALRSGFAAATADWVFYTDADAQFSLGTLGDLVAPLGRGFDAACGYRIRRRDAWPRRLNGWAWSRLTAAALGHPLRDVNCAFKIFPRAFLAETPTVSRAAAFPAELAAAATAQGLRIAEVGVPHLPRRAGRATGNRADVVGRGVLDLAWLTARRLRRVVGAQPPPVHRGSPSCSSSSR